MPDVLYDVSNGVALVTFNRPERLNALDAVMTDLYVELMQEAEADPHVRAIVVTGAGRGFCAGADTTALSEADPAALGSAVRAHPRDVAMTIGKPVVAAINGAAIGIGLCHALMADVRFAAEDAKLSTGFAALGLVAEMGSSWLLSRVVGHGRAMDLLLSARTLTGSQAAAIGLVEWAIPRERVLREAIEYAETLAANSPYSMAQIREQMQLDATRGWPEAFADSQGRMLASLARGEVRQRIAARAAAADTKPVR